MQFFRNVQIVGVPKLFQIIFLLAETGSKYGNKEQQSVEYGLYFKIYKYSGIWLYLNMALGKQPLCKLKDILWI